MRFIYLVPFTLLWLPLLAQQNYCDLPNAFLISSTPTTIDTQTVFIKKLNDYYQKEFWIKLKIHSPKNDNLPFSKRPMLIGIHGGAWLSDNAGLGTLATDAYRQMSILLDSFATQYGYITASLDYRTGYGGGNEAAVGLEGSNPGSLCNIADWAAIMTEVYHACYRAVQDSRTALSYIVTHADEFDIDTNNIFLLGISAGAITALHTYYSDEREFFPNGAGNAGGLEELPKIRAVISGMGAMFRRFGSHIDSSERTPIQAIHGLNDIVVAHNNAPLLGCRKIPTDLWVEGDSSIADTLCRLGHTNELILVEGMGHDLSSTNGYFPLLMRTFIKNTICNERVLDSNYRYLFGVDKKLQSISTCPIAHAQDTVIDTTTSVVRVEKLAIDVFPNPSTTHLYIIRTDSGLSSCHLTIYDVLGKEMMNVVFNEKNIQVDVSHFPAGKYILTLEMGRTKRQSRRLEIIR